MIMEICNSVDKADNGKAVPTKFEIVMVDDADYGLCLGVRNFSTGKMVALYKSCEDAHKDLGIPLSNLPLIELAKISDIHKSANHTYYYNELSVRTIKDYLFEQNMVAYCKK